MRENEWQGDPGDTEHGTSWTWQGTFLSQSGAASLQWAKVDATFFFFLFKQTVFFFSPRMPLFLQLGDEGK